MEPITLRFSYSRAEYMQAVRVHFASRLRLPLDIAVISALTAIAFYLWHTENQHDYVFFLIAMNIAFVAILVLAFTLLPYLLFRGQPTLKDEYILTFSEQEIHFATTHLNSTLQWSIYRRALISSNFHLLYHGSRNFSVIPNRAFASVEQQARFDQLIHEKLSKIDQISRWGSCSSIKST